MGHGSVATRHDLSFRHSTRNGQVMADGSNLQDGIVLWSEEQSAGVVRDFDSCCHVVLVQLHRVVFGLFVLHLTVVGPETRQELVEHEFYLSGFQRLSNRARPLKVVCHLELVPMADVSFEEDPNVKLEIVDELYNDGRIAERFGVEDERDFGRLLDPVEARHYGRRFGGGIFAGSAHHRDG